MKKTFLLALALVMSSGVLAQEAAGDRQQTQKTEAEKSSAVPGTIDFQGRLHDSGGSPVNASLNITFAIYDLEAGGVPFWAETHTAVEVSDGLFQVTLGTLNPLSPDLFAESDSRWLGIQVGSEAEMSPRTKFSSVAYALQSGGASNVWTLSADHIYYNAGNVGIGTTIPSALLHTYGTGIGEGNVLFAGGLKLTDPGQPPVSGVGTRMMWYPDKAAFRAGYVSDTQWDQANTGSFSVAMGYSTTASGDYSTAMGRNTIASGKFSSASGFYTIAPSYMETVIGRYNSEYSPYDPNGWIDTDRLFVIGNGASSSLRNNALTILKNGNAGIGTENPTALLHTYGIELGQGNVVFVGEAKADEFAEYGAPPISGGGTRMMWYPDKAAFRAGSVVDTQWDIENIGFYSVAFGASSKASGLMSSAFGGGTIASGYFSSSFGRFTEASGISSTALGTLTIASGSSSIATGDGTIASGYASTAMGRKTTSPSAYETAIGSFNLPYTPSMPDAWFGTDRLFVIGNGSSSSSPSNAMTVLKNGNTGIGADNPVHKLDVKGNSRIQLTNNNETAWLAMRTDGDLLDFSFSGAALNIQGMQDGENILLNPFKTSKVGIRTWVPEYDLDVNGSFRANVMNITGQASITEKMVIGSTTQKGRLFLANADGAGNAFNIGTSEGDFANFYFLSSGLIFDCYRASDERRQPILLQPNGGRVGIGTIDPTALLHVKGNSRIQLTNDNETAWLAMRTDGDLLDFSFSGTALTIQGMLDGENIFLNPVRNSKVGIRTWVPEYDLDVNGSFRANVMNITGQASITEKMVIGSTTQKGRLFLANADGAGNALKIGTAEGDFANLYFLSSGLIFDCYRASDARRQPILFQPNGGNVGIGTTAPAALLHIEGLGDGKGNVVFIGEKRINTSFPPPVSGEGTRMMWYPDKAAFRAGYVFGYEWDENNIGFYSIAMGNSTKASSSFSTAMGLETIASGGGSTALGIRTTASANASTAMGQGTIAGSYCSTALGFYNLGGGDPSVWVETDPLFEIGNGSSETSRSNALTVLKNGNMGIGMATPAYKLDISGNSRIQLSKTNGEWIAMRTDGSLLDFSFSGNNLAIQGSNDGENIVLNPTRLSKVGIRMWIPMYDLDVNGNIRATGSVYYGGTAGSANGTAYTKPDFVFEEGYEALHPIEVEEFLLKEKHLPWITSAAQEEQENGEVIDMTRMAFETVETVENLQLQIIEQNKLILELKSENEELKQNSSQLNARLERLEQALKSLEER